MIVFFWLFHLSLKARRLKIGERQPYGADLIRAVDPVLALYDGAT